MPLRKDVKSPLAARNDSENPLLDTGEKKDDSKKPDDKNKKPEEKKPDEKSKAGREEKADDLSDWLNDDKPSRQESRRSEDWRSVRGGGT